MSDKRELLKQQYGQLYDEISSILFRHDMVKINFEDNTDEYDPEVDAILPRLNEAVNKEDVANIIYEEFIDYFGEDVIKPKGHTGYMAMADEIWNVWSLK
ncbi:MAG TPA: hypothetical protein EYQ43_04465 [Methyloprofundus sp.]|jgi:hypothetical protein|nr:hypothetical protein [Methyloprofundus sp.]